jgi:SAM-dependent methyltransferase
MITDKIERERKFHNERFSQRRDPRDHLNKWYGALRHGTERQNGLVLHYAAGKDVLEYGCADGALSLDCLALPRTCRSLTGIDISEVAIAKANARCNQSGLNNASFLVMDAEAMTLPNHSFDLVFGRGIVHHLDLNKCFSEIARVLRPNGVAIFAEPVGHNPLLNLYRTYTPDIRTDDEHPLRMSDFALARKYFAKVETKFYGFFSVASVLLDSSTAGVLYRLGKLCDDVILRVPFIGRYAWHCLIVCRHEQVS